MIDVEHEKRKEKDKLVRYKLLAYHHETRWFRLQPHMRGVGSNIRHTIRHPWKSISQSTKVLLSDFSISRQEDCDVIIADGGPATGLLALTSALCVYFVHANRLYTFSVLGN